MYTPPRQPCNRRETALTAAARREQRVDPRPAFSADTSAQASVDLADQRRDGGVPGAPGRRTPARVGARGACRCSGLGGLDRALADSHYQDATLPQALLGDDELRAAEQEDRARKNAQRLRQAEATSSNLGLGHDLRAGLMDPTPGQLHALKAIICHLLAKHYRT